MSKPQTQSSKNATPPENANTSVPSTQPQMSNVNLPPMDDTYMYLKCIEFSLRLVDWDVVVKIKVEKDGKEDMRESNRITKNSKIKWPLNLYVLEGSWVTIEIQTFRLLSRKTYASFEFKLVQTEKDIVLESAENIAMKARLTFDESKFITGVSTLFHHVDVTTALNDSCKKGEEKFTVEASLESSKNPEAPHVVTLEMPDSTSSNSSQRLEMKGVRLFTYGAEPKLTKVRVIYNSTNSSDSTTRNLTYNQVSAPTTLNHDGSKTYTLDRDSEERKSDPGTGSQKKSTAKDSITVNVTSTLLGINLNLKCLEEGSMEIQLEYLAFLQVLTTDPCRDLVSDSKFYELIESVYKKYCDRSIVDLDKPASPGANKSARPDIKKPVLHPEVGKLFKTLKERLQKPKSEIYKKKPAEEILKDVRAMLEWSVGIADVSDADTELKLSSANRNEEIKSLKNIEEISWLEWDKQQP